MRGKDHTMDLTNFMRLETGNIAPNLIKTWLEKHPGHNVTSVGSIKDGSCVMSVRLCLTCFKAVQAGKILAASFLCVGHNDLYDTPKDTTKHESAVPDI